MVSRGCISLGNLHVGLRSVGSVAHEEGANHRIRGLQGNRRGLGVCPQTAQPHTRGVSEEKRPGGNLVSYDMLRRRLVLGHSSCMGVSPPFVARSNVFRLG